MTELTACTQFRSPLETMIAPFIANGNSEGETESALVREGVDLPLPSRDQRKTRRRKRERTVQAS
jgi:hypothetical protein